MRISELQHKNIINLIDGKKISIRNTASAWYSAKWQFILFYV